MRTNPLYLEPKGTISLALLECGIPTFEAAAKFITQLPYGRNSNRDDLMLVIRENCGTCSSKHAFLKQLAIEQGWDQIELILCIYLMSAENTPGIGSSLAENGLMAIPEAHCYLRIEGQRFDYTRPGASLQAIEEGILEELPVLPSQVIDFKPAYHRRFMDQWRMENGLLLSLEELWNIRERCIRSLSGK